MPIETTFASGASRGYGKGNGGEGGILLPFPFTVTTSKTGRLGPTSTEELIMTNYVPGLLISKQQDTGIFMITLTAGTYDMVASGASGATGTGAGLSSQIPGYPARASGRYTFTGPTKLLLLVGQRAINNMTSSQDGPGGGGTFIVKSPGNSSSSTAYTSINISDALLVGGGSGMTDNSGYSNNVNASTNNNGGQGSGGVNPNYGGTNGYGGQHGCGAGAAGLLGNGGEASAGAAHGGATCGSSTNISAGDFTTVTGGWENSSAFKRGGMGGSYSSSAGGFGGGAPTGNNGFGGGGGYSGGGSTYSNSQYSGGGGSFAGNGATNASIVLGSSRNVSGFITITQIIL